MRRSVAAEMATTVELYRAKERAVIGHLIIDLLRTAHGARRRLVGAQSKSYLAGEIENMLLAWAVLLGHVNGKPRNASEIGRFIGVPRVTAQRKLDDLAASGIIVRHGSRYLMAESVAGDDEYIDKCMLLIKHAAQLNGP